MNGTGRREQNEFSVVGLTAGDVYRFKVQAINFNGLSANSSEYEFNACLAPSFMIAPWRIDSTTTSITLGWSEPQDDGGCPLTGFAVFRDDGTGTEPTTEVNLDSDPNVREIPTLR